MKCPKCGGVEFKDVKEVAEQKYKQCANCKYSPSLEHAESQSPKEWVEGIAKELTENQEAFNLAKNETDTKPASTLLIGRYNKAKRLLSLSESRMQIADAISQVVDNNEQGMVTIHIPNLGLYQFTWGGYELFKALGKTAS